MEDLRAWFASTMILLLLVCASALAQTASMQLTTAGKGWALSGSHLFWTADNGSHWKDIAPPDGTSEGSTDVFFLDESRGWALLYSDDTVRNLLTFRLASAAAKAQSNNHRETTVTAPVLDSTRHCDH